MPVPNSWKPIHLGARMTIKVPMPCHSFSKGKINIWHRRLGHASEETLRMLGFHGDLDESHIFPQGNSNTPSFQEKHPTLNNF